MHIFNAQYAICALLVGQGAAAPEETAESQSRNSFETAVYRNIEQLVLTVDVMEIVSACPLCAIHPDSRKQTVTGKQANKQPTNHTKKTNQKTQPRTTMLDCPPPSDATARVRVLHRTTNRSIRPRPVSSRRVRQSAATAAVAAVATAVVAVAEIRQWRLPPVVADWPDGGRAVVAG